MIVVSASLFGEGERQIVRSIGCFVRKDRDLIPALINAVGKTL